MFARLTRPARQAVTATRTTTTQAATVSRAVVVAPSPLSSFSTAAASSSSAASASSSAPTYPSFVEKASAEGASSLIGPFHSGGRFDSCLSGLQVTRMDEASGEAEAVMSVTRDLTNAFGTLHGGATATLVDVVGTLALLTKDPHRPGVSVDLNVSYLRAVKGGQKVRCVGRVLKTGRSLGYTEVELYTEDGQLAATGRHTKAFQGGRPKADKQ